MSPRAARRHAARPARGRAGVSAPALAAAGGFALVYALAAVVHGLPAWCHATYAATNVACFALHALDKSAARANGRRIRERTLLALAAAGGWPGGAIAQQALRHKTAKPAFRARFWAGAAANAAAFAAAMLATG